MKNLVPILLTPWLVLGCGGAADTGLYTTPVASCAEEPPWATAWADCSLQAACEACRGACSADCSFTENTFLDSGIGRFSCASGDAFVPGQYRDACSP